MSQTARMWRGLGPLTLSGLILTGVTSRAADTTPLPKQLTELGQQALAQGASEQAKKFYRKALELDPRNGEAKRALSQIRVAFQA
ncbi:tetratricopeptide repeat protein, partial [Singulisphaera acidiphila]